MASIPAPGRSAANVLLDAVTAFDPDRPASAPVDLSLQRLAEIDDAYVVTIHGDGDDATVDINLSHLLGGTLTAMHWLVAQLASARQTTPEEIVSDVRAFLAD